MLSFGLALGISFKSQETSSGASSSTGLWAFGLSIPLLLEGAIYLSIDKHHYIHLYIHIYMYVYTYKYTYTYIYIYMAPSSILHLGFRHIPFSLKVAPEKKLRRID